MYSRSQSPSLRLALGGHENNMVDFSRSVTQPPFRSNLLLLQKSCHTIIYLIFKSTLFWHATSLMIKDQKTSMTHDSKFAIISPKSVNLFAEIVGAPGLTDDLASSLAEDATYRLRETLQVAVE